MILMKAGLYRSCSGVVIPLQMHTYLVSDIFRDHKRFLIARSILVLEPQNVRQPTLSDILRPSMQTLRHIVVNIHVVVDGDDSLLDIPSEFEDMRTKNIIETVTIRILFRSYESYRLEEDHWGRLDEILISPGWFSLKRISLSIKIYSYNSGVSELEEAFQKLPEKQFPRLSSSKFVSLDIKVNPPNT